jgi:hypothetical protein
VTIYFGLRERCELSVTRIPGPSDGGRFEYTDYKCRAFPLREDDKCAEEENSILCVAWMGARYASELAVGIAAAALLAILFGVMTSSTRRRAWRVVAGLVFLHALLQIAAFAIVTDLYRTSDYPPFQYAKFGLGYGLSAASWVIAVVITAAILVTGISADAGMRWAAGNRPYLPIQG